MKTDPEELRVRRVASSHWVGTKDTGEIWVEDVLVGVCPDDATAWRRAEALCKRYQFGEPFVHTLFTWAKPFMGTREFTSGYFVCRTTLFDSDRPEVNTFVEYACIEEMDSTKPRTSTFRRMDSIDYDPQQSWCRDWRMKPTSPLALPIWKKQQAKG